MRLAFLFLCFFAGRISGYEINFCGHLKEPEPELRTWRTQDELLAIIENRKRINTVSSSHYGLKGTDTEPHMLKWMAFYHTEWPGSHQQERCGGVLISNSAVLTAGHCLHSDGETAHVTSVTLGVHDIQSPGDSMLEIPVERTVIHKHFNRTGNLEYDVGILFLREEIVWTNSTNIRPICLPTGSETNQYTKATVTGWGFSQGDNAASTLQKGDMTVYDQQTCSHIFNRTLDSEVDLCGCSLNQESACKGDKGGPVISRRPDQLQYEVIGIIGEGNCVSSLTPAGTRYARVFTKIADDRMLDWIHAELLVTSCPAKMALEKATSEYSELEIIFGERNSDLVKLREKYSELERTLGERDTDLEDIRGKNFELEKILGERDTALVQISAEKSELEFTLGERETALEEIRGKNSELENTLVEKDTALEEVGGNISELEETMSERVTALKQVSADKSELEITLQDRNTEIQELKTIVVETEKRLGFSITDKVLLMGGMDSSHRRLTSVESYGNCKDNTEQIPVPSSVPSAAVLGGSVYLCGGWTNPHGSTVSCYIRASTQWTTGPNMVKARFHFSLNTVGDRLVAVGGFTSGTERTVEVLDPVSPTWTLQGYTLDVKRSTHCAVTMSHSTLMLVGGSQTFTTQLLNVDTGSVTQYSDLPYTKILQGPACGVFQGQVMLTGGYDGSSYTSGVFKLDPSNTGNPWISAGSLVHARKYHTMEILNGVPTVFGGRGVSSFLSSIEELQPNGTWKDSGILSQARYEQASVTLQC